MINMVFTVINILLVTNLVIYVHGLPRMTKWNSCGLNHICLNKSVDIQQWLITLKAKLQHDFPKWNPNAFIVHDVNAKINAI
jgi:hypothetical protein